MPDKPHNDKFALCPHCSGRGFNLTFKSLKHKNKIVGTTYQYVNCWFCGGLGNVGSEKMSYKVSKKGRG